MVVKKGRNPQLQTNHCQKSIWLPWMIFFFFFAKRVIVLKSKELNKDFYRKDSKEITRGRRTKGIRERSQKKKKYKLPWIIWLHRLAVRKICWQDGTVDVHMWRTLQKRIIGKNHLFSFQSVKVQQLLEVGGLGSNLGAVCMKNTKFLGILSKTFPSNRQN